MAGRLDGWFRRLIRLVGLRPRTLADRPVPPGPTRPPTDHVILIDGTASSLSPGAETNIGLIWKILRESQGSDRMLMYQAGIQWQSWRDLGDVVNGRGLDRQIARAYGWLATRYRPGDRIILLGYSRGAFAVRSLAGVIGRVGLLRAPEATERNIRDVWRFYEAGGESDVARAFAQIHCHPAVEIDLIGVFDTVKALGLRLPLLWLATEQTHAFHDHRLGAHVRRGRQALALDETRDAFAPVLWETPPDWAGDLRQLWFRGTHGDIGGQLGGVDEARPLSNIPLVWMLEEIEALGLALPEGWRQRLPMDAAARSIGTWQGLSKLFWIRHRRRIGSDPSEALHPTAAALLPTVAPRLRASGDLAGPRP